MMVKYDNAYTMTTIGMTTTTTTIYLDKLTQPPRLGARVAHHNSRRRGTEHSSRRVTRRVNITLYDGSSRESSPTIGTTKRCNITTEGDAGAPHMLFLPPSPISSVTYQPSMGGGSEAGAGEPATESRQP